MRVFVAGTWSLEKADPYRSEAISIGRELALHGFHLACGPGTGIAKYVIEGYLSVNPRGSVRFYLPQKEEMEKVGEVVGEGADEIIQTELDYPMRNIFQIKESDALVIITGGDGTLEEALAALVDYRHPVAVYRGGGSAFQALEALLPIYPEWKEYIKITDQVSDLIDFIVERTKNPDD